MYIFIGIFLLVALVAVVYYNRLVQERGRVHQAAAQIDVFLERRADLIPNLIQTIKGYTKHEEGTLLKVVEARNKLLQASENQATLNEKMEISQELSNQLKSVFALTEAYPDLKANQNFLSLQEELTNTENKIAYARKLYTDLVGNYNISLESFPTNFLASLFGFKKEEYLQLVEEKRAVPKVEF